MRPGEQGHRKPLQGRVNCQRTAWVGREGKITEAGALARDKKKADPNKVRLFFRIMEEDYEISMLTFLNTAS